jgi:hypothetical protein
MPTTQLVIEFSYVENGKRYEAEVTVCDNHYFTSKGCFSIRGSVEAHTDALLILENAAYAAIDTVSEIFAVTSVRVTSNSEALNKRIRARVVTRILSNIETRVVGS